jgi:hypothetical protein
MEHTECEREEWSLNFVAAIWRWWEPLVSSARASVESFTDFLKALDENALLARVVEYPALCCAILGGVTSLTHGLSGPNRSGEVISKKVTKFLIVEFDEGKLDAVVGNRRFEFVE